MKVAIISDTHGQHNLLKIPQGIDLLISCGDFSIYGLKHEYEDFRNWCLDVSPMTLVCPGNHEKYVKKFLGKNGVVDHTYKANERVFKLVANKLARVKGLKIWCHSWTPEYPPGSDWAWQLPRESRDLEEKVGRIPSSIDFLVSHGPPGGFLDKVRNGRAGCKFLTNHLMHLQKKPKYVVFGHLHEGWDNSREFKAGNTSYINVACVTDNHCIRPDAPVILEVES